MRNKIWDRMSTSYQGKREPSTFTFRPYFPLWLGNSSQCKLFFPDIIKVEVTLLERYQENNMRKITDFNVKFWGVRGSHPVPGEGTQRYGGNTSCLEVQAGEHTVIFDAGTGIIGLGRDLVQRTSQNGQPVKAVLLFSHLHHDHTQGLPFFAPLYFPTTHLDLFVPNLYEKDPKTVLAEVMSAPVFPVSFRQTGAKKRLRSLCQTQVVVVNGNEVSAHSTLPAGLPENAVIIRTMHSYAHPQGVMIYRVEYQGKSLVYATDTECYAGGDLRLVNFARRADLLIHDAQYSEDHYVGALAGAPVTQGYGHSTASMACGTAQEAGVGQLVLFHHDPNYADKTIASIENQARKVFANTLAAREGQMIKLGERRSQPKMEDTLPLAKIQQRQPRATNWASA
jgi:phosphoribosyl 1,2-cyclic phosphodiesterase